MLIHVFANTSYNFAHGKGGKYCAEAQPVHAAQKEKGHGGGNGKADNVKTYFNARIAPAGNGGKLAREKVGWYNWQLAAVGKRHAEADNNVADDKINNIKRQALRQLLNPHFVHVNHGAEGRADNEAEQVHRHKAFA